MGEINALTRSEILYLSRRRLRLNQREMARRLGLNRNLVSLMEIGEIEAVEIKEKIYPTESELMLILRRRSKMSQDDLADRLGVSRFWVNRMENDQASVKRLREFWFED